MKVTVRSPGGTLVTTVELEEGETAHVQRVLWNARMEAEDGELYAHLKELYDKIAEATGVRSDFDPMRRNR